MSAARLAACLLLAACASLPPSVHEYRNARTIEAGYGRTWSAVVDVFAAHDWPIERLDEEAGVIVSAWIPDTREGGDYGQGGTLRHIEPGSEQVAVNVRVSRMADEVTRVRVHCFFRARWKDEGKGMWGTGTSRGVWEADVLKAIEEAAQ